MNICDLTRRWFVVLAAVCFVGTAQAFPWRPDRLPSLPDMSEPGMNGDACNVCHTTGGGTPRNPFGELWERTYPAAEDFGLTAQAAFASVAAQDPDGDGFASAEELSLGTHPGNATSKPLRFVRALVAGINTLSVPADPRRPMRASDVLALLGPRANHLIRWNASAGSFVRIDGSTPPGFPDNIAITGSTAFLVEMSAAADIAFVGRPWQSSRIALEPGINLVAVPKRPFAGRLSDIVGPGGIGIAYLSDERRFGAFSAEAAASSRSNVPLAGGEGYLILSPTKRDVDLGGVGWQTP
ncbi:hypothetical protein FJZ36_05910 [Candidatus Poribacteria bacterium]|nr:hypothetical protein [Candidatus Poribacteria bacterium]